MTDSRLPIFSYSQFSLYEKCPYAWHLSYIKKLKGNRRVFFEGSVVHKANRDLFLDPERSIDKVIEKLPGIFAAESKALDLTWENENPREVYENILKSFNCLIAFQRHFKILENKNTWSEYKFYLPMTTQTGISYALLGFIDMAYIDPETSSPIILDFKNSDDYKNFDKRQLLLYAFAWKRTTGENPGKIGFFLIRGKKLVWYPFDESEYQGLINKLDWVVSEIDQKKKMGASFEARPSWKCRFCQFESKCEFSSTKKVSNPIQEKP